MMETIPTKTPTRTTWEAACSTFFTNVLDGIEKLGNAYVQHMEAGFAASELQASIPSFSTDSWGRLERVGRGEMPPALWLYTGPRRVLLLGHKEFERIEGDGGIRMVAGDGGTTRVVPLMEITPDDAEVAIDDKGHVRAPSAQLRAMARRGEMKRLKKQANDTGYTWRVNRDGSATVNGLVMSKEDMKKLISDWHDAVTR